MYERRHAPPLSLGRFLLRMAVHVLAAVLLIAASLAGGMAGYRYFEELSWMDAFHNAAMILGGMGPVDLTLSPYGKLFAGLYALYSGLVFVGVAGILLAPVVHRVLHRFHWDDGSGGRSC